MESLRERAPDIGAALDASIKTGQIPGCVAGVVSVSDPNQIWLMANGMKRTEPTSESMQASTWFDLASLTKVVGTTLSIFRQIDRHWASLEMSLAEMFPGQATRPCHRAIRLGHLLAHTSGYVAFDEIWKALRQLPFAERKAALLNHLLDLEPVHPVGTRVVYSDIGFLLLGCWLEAVTGQAIDQVWRDLWDDLDITELGVRLTDSEGWPKTRDRESVAATEAVFDGLHRSVSGYIEGLVHDPTAYVLGGVAGHAGVFGTARAVLELAQRLQFAWRGMRGFPGIQASLLKTMFSPVGSLFSPAEGMRCFGWDRPSAEGSSAGTLFSRDSVGHLGFTGTSLWMDLDRGLSAVLLTNRVHFGREAQGIRELRPLFHDMVIRNFAVH